MARKRHEPEEFVDLPRKAEALRGQGLAMTDASRQLGISEVAPCRWRNENGGMSGDHLRRLEELEEENERLRRAVRTTESAGPATRRGPEATQSERGGRGRPRPRSGRRAWRGRRRWAEGARGAWRSR